MSETIRISAVLYQEGRFWIAQGLEFDIAAQADTLPKVCSRFAVKVASEMVISLDLNRKPLEGIAPAPQKFWRMFETSNISVQPPQPVVRVDDRAPEILPLMRVADLPQTAAAV